MDKLYFKNVKELIDEELRNLNVPEEFQNLERFINHGKTSAEFIRWMLKDDDFGIPNEENSLYDIAEMRARHSVVIFLLGLVFRRFEGLFDKIPFIVNMDEGVAEKMWLIASLYHDKAYASEYIRKSDLDYHTTFAPFLLGDKISDQNYKILEGFSLNYPHTLAYPYSTILHYDNYAVEYHKRENTFEKRDHGILGGVMMFSELSKKAVKQNQLSELTIIKACSLAVAQHNIFKSQNQEDDAKYKKHQLYILLSTSNFRIKKEKALLLFLSLVDTIECVKKFSKSQNATESNKWLETLTVLNSITVAISEEQIIIDISELSKRVAKKKDEGLLRILDGYKKSLCDFNTWTEFNCCGEDDVFTITLTSAVGAE